eukprot:125208_1
MGSSRSKNVNKNKTHICVNKCLKKILKKKKPLECIWHPSKPFRWEYTNNHHQALQYLLNSDKDLQYTSNDIIKIIESYVKDICISFKKEEIYYKRIRSKIYNQQHAHKSKLKLCEEFYKDYINTQTVRTDINYHLYTKRDLKIVLLGSSAVEKRMLCQRICGDYYCDEYDPVIEDSWRKMVAVNDEAICVELLLASGMEEFSAMREYWIKEGDVYWLCFNVMYCRTFLYALDCLEEIIRVIYNVNDSKNIIIIFVGCQVDRRFDGSKGSWQEYDEIDSFEIMEIIESIGNFPYIEVSAKKNENAHYLMDCLLYETWIQSEIIDNDWNDVRKKCEAAKKNLQIRI